MTRKKSVKDKERDLGSKEKMLLQEVVIMKTCQVRTSKARRSLRKLRNNIRV